MNTTNCFVPDSEWHVMAPSSSIVLGRAEIPRQEATPSLTHSQESSPIDICMILCARCAGRGGG